MKLNNLVPMLNVSALETSLNFYREALGFEVVSPIKAISEWRWATIRSGGTSLMLSETDAGPKLRKEINSETPTSWPVIFYFYPEDVESLYQQVTARGFSVTSLEVTFYGMKEFSMYDPDGHLLSFGQEVEE